MAETSFIRNFLSHKYALIALGAVVVIGAGSALYYYEGTRVPQAPSLPATSTAASAVTASGDVEPLENPDLSFAASGRIAYVGVAAGDRVYAGQTLASLDVAALSAQKNQALANEKAAQAKLDALQAPARATDVAIKQSAVDQATQTRANTYASLPATLSDAYAKASDAVHVASDNYFSNPNTPNPSLTFNVSSSDAANAAVSARVTVGTELSNWNTELSSLPANPSETALDSALSASLAHLAVVRSFEDSLITTLNLAIPTTAFPSSSISAAQSSVSGARATVNGLITALTAAKQSLVSETLAIEAAQASLAQLNAGASSQDIEAAQAAVESAEANVSAIQAQIANNVISAPFSGTVGSVSIKTGELATMNTPAITLVPDSGLEVVVYVSEIDAARLKAGDVASVTLDAFGSGRVFPAHVSAVDTAPSTENGISAYKVKLTFDSAEPDAKTGMTANATITPNAQ
jgi:multidrug resistance efflux pump